MLSLSSLNTVKELLNSLSWKKILQLAILFSVIIMAWMLFENRTEIYKYYSSPRFIKSVASTLLSKKTTDAVDSVVDSSDLIVGIHISLVNFKTNTSAIIYSTADNKDLKAAFDAALETSIAYLPLFNTDPNNNRRLVAVIDGDFVCDKYEGSVMANTLPGTTLYISSLCISGIPPYYGKISGMITIFTRRPPSPEEVDQLRVLSRNLSTTIYNTDLK